MRRYKMHARQGASITITKLYAETQVRIIHLPTNSLGLFLGIRRPPLAVPGGCEPTSTRAQRNKAAAR